MVAYTNFFETLQEANMRLRGTMILYDSEPYFVSYISDHKDGKFRIYLTPLGLSQNRMRRPEDDPNSPLNNLSYDNPTMPGLMDKYMNENPKLGMLRKTMDSPHFNKFRPFPLGMCNFMGKTLYIERSPVRKTEQGLTFNMLHIRVVSPTQHSSHNFKWDTEEFYNCIVGQYPTPQECIDGLFAPNTGNDGVAFHRDFALIKGVGGVCLLAYKDMIVGYLPDRDYNKVYLLNDYKYVQESIINLGLFNKIDYV